MTHTCINYTKQENNIFVSFGVYDTALCAFYYHFTVLQIPQYLDLHDASLLVNKNIKHSKAARSIRFEGRLSSKVIKTNKNCSVISLVIPKAAVVPAERLKTE